MNYISHFSSFISDSYNPNSLEGSPIRDYINISQGISRFANSPINFEHSSQIRQNPQQLFIQSQGSPLRNSASFIMTLTPSKSPTKHTPLPCQKILFQDANYVPPLANNINTQSEDQAFRSRIDLRDQSKLESLRVKECRRDVTPIRTYIKKMNTCFPILGSNNAGIYTSPKVQIQIEQSCSPCCPGVSPSRYLATPASQLKASYNPSNEQETLEPFTLQILRTQSDPVEPVSQTQEIYLKKKRLFREYESDVEEERSVVEKKKAVGRKKPVQKAKRNRKTKDQILALKHGFTGNPLSKERIRELSKKTGLTEDQVYKWDWDQRKKNGFKGLEETGIQVHTDEFGGYSKQEYAEQAESPIAENVGINIEKCLDEILKEVGPHPIQASRFPGLEKPPPSPQSTLPYSPSSLAQSHSANLTPSQHPTSQKEKSKPILAIRMAPINNININDTPKTKSLKSVKSDPPHNANTKNEECNFLSSVMNYDKSDKSGKSDMKCSTDCENWVWNYDCSSSPSSGNSNMETPMTRVTSAETPPADLVKKTQSYNLKKDIMEDDEISTTPTVCNNDDIQAYHKLPTQFYTPNHHFSQDNTFFSKFCGSQSHSQEAFHCNPNFNQ